MQDFQCLNDCALLCNVDAFTVKIKRQLKRCGTVHEQNNVIMQF